VNDEPHNRVCELASEDRLNDDVMLGVFTKVADALVGAFGPTGVDTGMGGGWCDFWIRDGDVEYKLTMNVHRSLAKPQ
jgi:hypothetical protein